jgi:hypothetical protein
MFGNFDREVRDHVSRAHMDMYRDIVTGAYDAPLPFELRHDACNEKLCYNLDSKDAPASTWTCYGCTAPANLLFRDLELERMSMVRLKQLVYVARQYSSKEDVQVLTYDDRKGHGHHYLRPIRSDEWSDFQLRIVNGAVASYVKAKK